MPRVTKDVYPEWKKWLWRLLRGALAGGIAQVLLTVDFLNPKAVLQLFTDPYETVNLLAAAFLGGFIMALGVALRDKFGSNDKSKKLHKLPL